MKRSRMTVKGIASGIPQILLLGDFPIPQRNSQATKLL